MKVQSKTILVTGGGSGIGRELVLILLKRGARVVALDINKESLEETVHLAGDQKKSLSTYLADISDKESVEETISNILSDLGEVDGLINNAGIIQPFVKLKDLEYEAIERVMNVNFWGTLYLTKSLLPHLLKRPKAHIVNISSMGGFLPVPGQTLYGASKAAVKLMTEGLYSELADTNVNVSVVFPGAVATGITANSGLESVNESSGQNSNKNLLLEPLKPTEAAQIIIEGIERDRYRLLIGKDSKFMDFLTRLSPKFAAKFINKKMKELLS